VPLATARGVVHPREAKLERLQRHVIEASKQCRRNMLMRVGPVEEWADFCARADLPGRRLLAHPGGGALPAGGGGTVAGGGGGGGCRRGRGPRWRRSGRRAASPTRRWRWRGPTAGRWWGWARACCAWRRRRWRWRRGWGREPPE